GTCRVRRGGSEGRSRTIAVPAPGRPAPQSPGRRDSRRAAAGVWCDTERVLSKEEMTDAEGWPSPVEGVRLEIAPERVTRNHSDSLTITSEHVSCGLARHRPSCPCDRLWSRMSPCVLWNLDLTWTRAAPPRGRYPSKRPGPAYPPQPMLASASLAAPRGNTRPTRPSRPSPAIVISPARQNSARASPLAA